MECVTKMPYARISIIGSGLSEDIHLTAPERNGEPGFRCSAPPVTTEGTLFPSLESPTVRSYRFNDESTLRKEVPKTDPYVVSSGCWPHAIHHGALRLS